MEKTPSVELKHISKYFAKVVANKDVSLKVYPGEVLALLGENGAGKSTIMKILYGLYNHDEGDIFIQGEKTEIKSPMDAKKKGISMVQQHFSLVPTHTGTENIILGNKKGYIPIADYNKQVKALSDEYGFDVPVDVHIEKLAVGQQQKIEILKALYINAKILILDEPTAVLTPQESETLMTFIRSYIKKGNSVIFITHKLKEVMEVATRVVVMRNGIVVGERERAELEEHDLAKLMIGEEIVAPVRDNADKWKELPTVLTVDKLCLSGKKKIPILTDISFNIHKSEIYGIAGVSGNGQDELCDVLCGLKKPDSGCVRFYDKDVTFSSILEHNSSGLGYVPLDRHRDALVMGMTLSENVLLKNSFSDRWSNKGFIKKNELDAYTSDLIEKHRIKATGPSDLAGGLSGGNQQKAVLGREVDIGTHLLVFNQPTRGLDMGAVDRIHHVMMDEKEKGKAILLISTEISELFEMCDVISVMYRGKMMGEYTNGELTAENLGLLMAGVRPEGL